MTFLELTVPYGETHLSVRVPTDSVMATLLPEMKDEQQDEVVLLRRALEEPIGSPRLREIVQPGEQVVIVTSDLTRPCPSERLLPPVLDELNTGGVPDEAITVVMALGLHRPMTVSEMQSAVGSTVYRRVQVLNHNPDDTVSLGTTQAGTPVQIFRAVVAADRRVCLGNLELHYFAGFSGGYKAILPGCASLATVQANHAMMVLAGSETGRLVGNPVRTDIDEGAAMVGVDFILNVVADGQHRIAGAVAGDPIAAHRQGCELVKERGILPIPRLADIVLASAGGTPKDLNLYQAQKALDNASYAVRDGGIIILVAECPEGLGNATFERWMREAKSPADLVARVQSRFELGGHKAAAIASVLLRASVFLVSVLPAELCRRCGLVPFESLDRALDAAWRELGTDSRMLAMPQAASTLPSLVSFGGINS